MKKTIVRGLLLGIFLWTACEKKTEEEVNTPVKNVVSERITFHELFQTFESDAVLEPKEKVRHSTEKGGSIEKIYKKNGDFVKKGDLVIRFSDAGTKASYLQALANLQSTKSSYQIAEGNYRKFRQLYEKALVSHLEYVNYENSYVAAKGQYEAAKALFQSAKSDYDKLQRRADISGVIGNLFGKEGNYVKAKEEVFTVLNDSEMQAYIGLPGEYVSKLGEGSHVKLWVESLGKEYEATIEEINPIAEPNTKNFMTKLLLSNERGELKDGMYASIQLPVERKEVLSVPKEAIFIRNLIPYLFKIVEGKAVRIEVQTGAESGEYTEIISEEIQEGDRVVVKGLFGLQDGEKVREEKKTHMGEGKTKKGEEL